MLPWMLTNLLGVNNEAPEGIVPDSVKWSFYLGGVVFFLAVLWTVWRSREYSPEEMAAFEENQEEQGFVKEKKTGESYATRLFSIQAEAEKLKRRVNK